MAIKKRSTSKHPIPQDASPAIEIPEPTPFVTKRAPAEPHHEAIICKHCGHAYLEPCATDEARNECRNWQWKKQHAATA